MCFCIFGVFLQRERGTRSQHKARQREDRKDVASDLEPDETRHMMCPSNPPTRQDSTNTPAFFFFLVFTSISFCNIVSAWSCLLWPTVSLFCRSGKGLVWRFHALFSVSPFASEDGGVQFVSPSLLLRSLFVAPTFAKPPFIFKFSFMLTLFVITLSHPP